MHYIDFSVSGSAQSDVQFSATQRLVRHDFNTWCNLHGKLNRTSHIYQLTGIWRGVLDCRGHGMSPRG